MTTTANDPGMSPALVNLLAVYLASAPGLQCPGCDGLLTAEIVSDYPAAAASGVVPGETELCDRHPELSAHIVAFFFLMGIVLHHRPDSATVNDPITEGSPCSLDAP